MKKRVINITDSIFARRLLIILCAGLVSLFVACAQENGTDRSKPGRLTVVTSLFPLYDFARTIAGGRAEVNLLMPPGVEPHGFEPRPDDMLRISRAGLFIYTNPFMEPWAEKVIRGNDGGRTRVVEAGKGAAYQAAILEDGDDHAHDDHPGGLDPHIWLDFGIDQLLVDNILAGFVAADPPNAAFYRANAALLKNRLADLDNRYRDGLKSCASRDILHGGHYAFGYLARRYDLRYRSLSGVSSESEPSAARMAAMLRSIRKSGVHYLFAEELLSPRLAETLAKEAGVEVLRLQGAHNLSRDEFQRGVGFIALMDDNLASLRKGLACR